MPLPTKTTYCGGIGSYTGSCGAPDCGRCHPELHRDGWYVGDSVACEMCEEWLDEDEEEEEAGYCAGCQKLLEEDEG